MMFAPENDFEWPTSSLPLDHHLKPTQLGSVAPADQCLAAQKSELGTVSVTGTWQNTRSLQTVIARLVYLVVWLS